MPRKALWFAVAALAAAVASARGDEVIFNNGDRLSGKIVTLADGKLTIAGTVVGDVTTALANVKTFSTDAPVEIHTSEGRTYREKIVAGAEPGQITASSVAMPLTQLYAINPKKDAWTGSVVASGLATRGNSSTESLSVNASASLERRTPRNHDRTTLGAGYLFGRQRDDDTGEHLTTTDSFFVQGKYDYFWTPKLYGYAISRLERDRIADLDYRIAPGVGLGYEWSERWKIRFRTELGANYIYEAYEDDGHNQHAALRAAYHVDKQVNEKVTVFHNLEYLPAFEEPGDYNLTTDAGLRAQLTQRLFTEFKIEWKRDSTPAPESLKNDLRYTLGVGWNF